jgi:hypothetical protein
MHHGHDNHMEEPLECGRCDTPMVKGHGVVCALHWVSEAAFWGAIVLLLLFWSVLAVVLVKLLAGDMPGPFVVLAPLSAINSVLLFALSLTCGMRAKWLRHRIVQDMDGYLDADGSCCGGSCAGSCGDSGCGNGDCGEEGCSPEGCDDPDCCKKADDACGCGDACVCAGMGGCDDECDSCGETCGCVAEGSEEQGGCCGGGCCK